MRRNNVTKKKLIKKIDKKKNPLNKSNEAPQGPSVLNQIVEVELCCWKLSRNKGPHPHFNGSVLKARSAFGRFLTTQYGSVK